MRKKVTYIPFGDIIVMTIEHTLLYRSQSMVFGGSRCLLSPMLYDMFSLLRSDQCMHVASQSIFHAWFRSRSSSNCRSAAPCLTLVVANE